jgi:hypothetical protein
LKELSETGNVYANILDISEPISHRQAWVCTVKLIDSSLRVKYRVSKTKENKEIVEDEEVKQDQGPYTFKSLKVNYFQPY